MSQQDTEQSAVGATSIDEHCCDLDTAAYFPTIAKNVRAPGQAMRMPGLIEFMHSDTGSPSGDAPWTEVVERAKNVLLACNLPISAGFYCLKGDGTWVRDPQSDQILDRMNRGEDSHTALDQSNNLDARAYATRFRSVTRFAENIFGWGSDQQYAAQVLFLARRFELARQEQLMQAYGSLAFQLGALTESWRLAQSEGHARITGSRVIMGGRRAAEKTNGSPDQRRARDQELLASNG